MERNLRERGEEGGRQRYKKRESVVERVEGKPSSPSFTNFVRALPSAVPLGAEMSLRHTAPSSAP